MYPKTTSEYAPFQCKGLDSIHSPIEKVHAAWRSHLLHAGALPHPTLRANGRALSTSHSTWPRLSLCPTFPLHKTYLDRQSVSVHTATCPNAGSLLSFASFKLVFWPDIHTHLFTNLATLCFTPFPSKVFSTWPTEHPLALMLLPIWVTALCNGSPLAQDKVSDIQASLWDLPPAHLKPHAQYSGTSCHFHSLACCSCTALLLTMWSRLSGMFSCSFLILHLTCPAWAVSPPLSYS